MGGTAHRAVLGILEEKICLTEELTGKGLVMTECFASLSCFLMSDNANTFPQHCRKKDFKTRYFAGYH